MILTPENYYSREANEKYLSVSQYKSFMSCEAAALAELKEEFKREDKEAFLVGQYVHAWNEEKLDEFVCNHPEIVSSKGPTKGELKANFKVADEMIRTLETDEKVMKCLQGKKEVPISTIINGFAWKGKIDVLNEKYGYMVDLKTAKSISEFEWSQKDGKRVSFIEKYDYFTQVAIYLEMDRILSGGTNYKDFYIVAVTKENPPDHAIIDVSDHERVQQELAVINSNASRIVGIKNGEIQPARCEHCAYCRATKKVDKPIYYTELREAF